MEGGWRKGRMEEGEEGERDRGREGEREGRRKLWSGVLDYIQKRPR